MGLFSFKKPDEPTIKTLNDLFSFKFKDVPDDSFVISKDLNSEGLEVQHCRKILSVKECGIFDTLEVILIPPNYKNIVLSTTELHRINISDVRKLVDNIFLLIGKDDDMKGRFDNEDKQTFERGNFWSRLWIIGVRPFNCMVTLSPPTFEISLHGIEKL